MIVLESLEHAQKRGSKIYAELAGYGELVMHGILHLLQKMERRCKSKELAYKKQEYLCKKLHISMHMEQVLTIMTYLKPVRSNRYLEHMQRILSLILRNLLIGHLLGAAGAVELIVCVKTIQEGFIHQTAGTQKADPECDLNYAIGGPIHK